MYNICIVNDTYIIHILGVSETVLYINVLYKTVSVDPDVKVFFRILDL